jgi:hypothetical protein
MVPSRGLTNTSDEEEWKMCIVTISITTYLYSPTSQPEYSSGHARCLACSMLYILSRQNTLKLHVEQPSHI